MTDKKQEDDRGWMSDVQRALALILIGVLASTAALLVMRVVYSAPVDAVIDITKIMLAALVNMGLVALGFFFGNTMAKMAQDKASQDVVQKLTSPPPNGPVAPVPSPAASEPWWNKLTEAERTAITSSTDQRVIDFVKAPVTMQPLPDDLAYLISKGLLTQARATEIQSA